MSQSRPTTAQVKEAFRNRKPLATTNLISDGTSLFSYGHHEIARWVYPDCACLKLKGDPPDPQSACRCTPGAPKLVIRRNPPKGRNGKTSGYKESGPWFSMTTAHHASGVYNPDPNGTTEHATAETPYTEGRMRL
jgi:hypothetical protein